MSGYLDLHIFLITLAKAWGVLFVIVVVEVVALLLRLSLLLGVVANAFTKTKPASTRSGSKRLHQNKPGSGNTASNLQPQAKKNWTHPKPPNPKINDEQYLNTKQTVDLKH